MPSFRFFFIDEPRIGDSLILIPSIALSNALASCTCAFKCRAISAIWTDASSWYKSSSGASTPAGPASPSATASMSWCNRHYRLRDFANADSSRSCTTAILSPARGRVASTRTSGRI